MSGTRERLADELETAKRWAIDAERRRVFAEAELERVKAERDALAKEARENLAWAKAERCGRQQSRAALDTARRELDAVDEALAWKGTGEGRVSMVERLKVEREEVRSRILACIGDADGRRAVERARMLTLTAGQIQALAEALELLGGP